MERFGVHVAREGASEGGQVERLAAAAGLSNADARQTLNSNIPRRISDHGERSDADEVAARIRAAGFIAFVADAQELSAFRPAEVRGAAFDGGTVAFRPSGPASLRMIVHGRFTTSTDVRSEATVIDADSFARIGKGSAQVRQEQGEQFAHFHGQSPGEVVELRANRFDFRCLGPDLAATRAANLRAFLDKLRGLFPQALYDDTLVKHPLRSSGRDGFSFNASVFVGSVEQHTTKGSTEDAARRASWLIARARLSR